MARKETAEIANSDILGGDQLYIERARLVLPYLVRQAKANNTIYYSDLAELVKMPNARNLNYVLGSIGNALIELSKKTKIEIPAIQCIVINKRDELPGEGIGWFISKTDFHKLNKTQKKKVVLAQLAKIYTFENWDWVLEELGLEPIKSNVRNELKIAKTRKGGGESDQHRKFKEFIAKNPSKVLLGNRIKTGILEYPLPSADTIDVLFTNKGQLIGVEVKSSISDQADILRGIFQCIKYKHLIEAEQIVNNQTPNSRVILALQSKLPKELSFIKTLLGVEVIDQITFLK